MAARKEESFSEELKEHGAYCETRCDAIFEKKGTSIKRFWIIVGAISLFAVTALGGAWEYTTGTEHRLTAQSEQIDNNSSAIHDLNNWRVTFNDKIDKYHQEEMQAIRKGK